MRLQALIADDEPLARERLRFLLADDEEISLAGECRNGRETVAKLQVQRIDLLFLDIEMPGKGGFEVIEQIGGARMPSIIFVTAHNRYAVRAFDVQALDYLTKPIEPARLRAAVARAKQHIQMQASSLGEVQLRQLLTSLATAAAAKEYPQRLLVPHGARERFLPIDEIDWIEAADYYSCLYAGGKQYLLREPIKRLAETLDPRRFVRIHRSVIVPVDRVREILREGHGEGSVLLANGQRLRMSKTGWQNLLALSKR